MKRLLLALFFALAFGLTAHTKGTHHSFGMHTLTQIRTSGAVHALHTKFGGKSKH